MELCEIKGIGDATEQKLFTLGITTVYGLISFLPSKYVDLKLPVPALEAEEGQFSLFDGEVTSVGLPSRRGTKSFSVIFKDKLSVKPVHFKATFFNQPYLSQTVNVHDEYRILGKVVSAGGELSLINPVLERIDNIKHLEGIYTVYPLKGEIGQRTFKNLLHAAFDLIYKSGEFNVSDGGFIAALRSAHFPSSLDEAANSVEKLSALDLATGLVAYKKVRKSAEKPRRLFYNLPNIRILDFINALFVAPTPSQLSAFEDIFKDLNSGKNMSRIISGDVGSGKSLAAYAAIYYACSAGYQAAYMAPTEILAAQQFHKFSKIAETLDIKCSLLTSSTTGIERQTALHGLANGEIDAVFGTQSVIGADVKYKNLSLAVIDEQHKFGVSDRARIEDKGACDVLTLTATPIPRTLALTVYDDIAVSRIEKREDAATHIITKIVSDDRLDDLLKYVDGECLKDNQAFIVCPSIRDNEGLEVYSIEQFVKENIRIFDNLAVSILTGKTKANEKTEAMTAFQDGKTQLMLATSVIEVGIDTAANIIVVMNSERFGLASLHQLRGRVGRDGSSAYCFLHTKQPTERALERLTALENISDGNLLAEKDLDMRGAGEMLGTSQSGKTLSPYLKLPINAAVLKEARRIANDEQGAVAEFSKLTNGDYSQFIEKIQNVTLNS